MRTVLTSIVFIVLLTVGLQPAETGAASTEGSMSGIQQEHRGGLEENKNASADALATGRVYRNSVTEVESARCWRGYVTSSRRYAHGAGYIVGVAIVKGSIPVVALRSPWTYPRGMKVTVCGKIII